MLCRVFICGTRRRTMISERQPSNQISLFLLHVMISKLVTEVTQISNTACKLKTEKYVTST